MIRVVLAVVALVSATGCFGAPTPACGFVCGVGGACPNGYACNTDDNRCHFGGTEGSCETPDAPPADAGPDATPDLTPPTIVARDPEANATGVQMFQSISFTFDEDVTGATSSAVHVTADGDPVTGSVTYDPTSRTFSFSPLVSYPPGSLVTVMASSAIHDLSGNALVPDTWSFHVMPDTTPPTVSVFPSDGTTGVALTSGVVIIFDEPVTGVSQASFTLDQAGSPVTGSIVSTTNDVYNFVPAADLIPNTLYVITLTAAITDLSGNPIAGAPVSFSFTTGNEMTAPFVASQIPAINATNVPVDTTVSATFSEAVSPIDATTVDLLHGATTAITSVTYVPATFTAVANHDQLVENTLYTLTLAGTIHDAANNFLPAQQWNFTTGADAVAPHVIDGQPTGSTVDPNTTITIHFDEPVDHVDATSFVVDAGAGPIAGGFASSANDTTFVFTPSAALPAATLVTVTIGTQVTDRSIAANPLAAPFVFSFTTN